MILDMKTDSNKMNKQQQAYELIKARILNGEYGAGYRLVVDRIARELGVSAIPVREATRRLEAEGLVEYERFSGVRVIKIDEITYTETLEVLAVLEGYAAARASRYLTNETLEQLKRINKNMQKSRSSFDLMAYSELNQEFHRVICNSCKNTYLIGEWNAAQDRMNALRTTVFMLIPHRTTDSIGEHNQLIELFQSKVDEHHIEEFARRHKLATLHSFEEWKRKS